MRSFSELLHGILVLAPGLSIAAALVAAEEKSSAPREEAPRERTVEEMATDALSLRLTIPLDDGRLSLGLLLGRLGEEFGFDGRSIEEAVDLSLDVRGLLGEPVLEQVKSITRGIVRFDVRSEQLVVTLDRLQLRRQERELRKRFRSLMERLFPRAAAAAKTRYGLWCYSKGRDKPVRASAAKLAKRVVVLVHGLDEPGLIWRSLRPKLLAAAYTVAQLEYPNDQGLDDSAKLMAAELEKLKKRGVVRISVVAHSMGGLIARQVLTDPRWYDGRGTGHGRYPDVDRLIMVGTPQHGSPLAHLRMAAERLEQVIRILSGEGLLFGGVFDGAGEAKLDLLPHSEFLIALNRRPHPASVRMTIIAGRASPVSDERLEEVAELLKSRSNDEGESPVDAVSEALKKLSAGLGDGAVSLASSRLKGVDDYAIVDGNHISMLLNIIPGSKTTPPAIPIILERLKATEGS